MGASSDVVLDAAAHLDTLAVGADVGALQDLREVLALWRPCPQGGRAADRDAAVVAVAPGATSDVAEDLYILRRPFATA